MGKGGGLIFVSDLQVSFCLTSLLVFKGHPAPFLGSELQDSLCLESNPVSIL